MSERGKKKEKEREKKRKVEEEGEREREQKKCDSILICVLFSQFNWIQGKDFFN